VDGPGTNAIEEVGRALLSPVAKVWALILPYAWWLVPLGLVVLAAVYLTWFVAKGGGQYGIIEGYVGTIGAGKTTLAVQHSLTLARARGAVLLSNIPVVCGDRCKGWTEVRRAGPFWRRDTVRVQHGPEHVIEHDTLPMGENGVDLGELTRRAFVLRDAERGLVLLMDEVGVIMPARLWKDFSVALMWVLQQSRKLACEWIWTAQDPTFVDHQLRSLTSVVHYVRSWPPPSIWRRVKGKRPWLMIASAYTPSQAPRANGEGQRREKRIGWKLFRYQRVWERAFDTDGVVLPSRHLKGAEVLSAAIRGTADAHVIDSSSWGPSSGGAEEPEGVVIPVIDEEWRPVRGSG
jgi:Zonular occludens toxin (Zot)